MRLGAARPASDPRDRLATAADHILDRRLLRRSANPIAVAFSGGGDSLALLLIAHAWAEAAGRRLLVLTVDHRLQAASAGWTTACAALAARLGVAFHPLAWEGPKPAQGLPAAARAARHRLLAAAARQAGARVILMGHTADDLLEARAMRAEGSTTPDPREWGPSPAWPQGRGVFLLRPLLGLRRAEIRSWLDARGERWIDDPANQDPRFARVRARAGIGGAPADVTAAADTPLHLAQACRGDAAGALHIARPDLDAASDDDLQKFLSLACVCAGGGDRRPATARLQALARRLRTGAPVTATLAGARIEADDRVAHILREAGEVGRGGLASLILPADQATVWDGRFELETSLPVVEIRRLAGLARRLPANQRAALGQLHPRARPALPAAVDATGAVSCPLLDESAVTASSLVLDRLIAAAGLVASEPA